MARAIYPGSFDPVTRGHLDIVGRAARIFDELIIAVGVNPAKRPIFSVDERVDMIRSQVKGLSHVTVEAFDGLVVHFARDRAPAVIIRGLRDVTDFDLERRMALTNRAAGRGVETMFMLADPERSFCSSRLIRQIAAGGGDVSEFLTENVAQMLIERLSRGGST